MGESTASHGGSPGPCGSHGCLPITWAPGRSRCFLLELRCGCATADEPPKGEQSTMGPNHRVASVSRSYPASPHCHSCRSLWGLAIHWEESRPAPRAGNRVVFSLGVLKGPVTVLWGYWDLGGSPYGLSLSAPSVESPFLINHSIQSPCIVLHDISMFLYPLHNLCD